MHFSVGGMEVGLLLVRRNENAADVLLKVSSARVGGILWGTHLGAASLDQRVSSSSTYTDVPRPRYSMMDITFHLCPFLQREAI